MRASAARIVRWLSGKAGLGGAGGVHPTLRMTREGWGTRAVVEIVCGGLQGGDGGGFGWGCRLLFPLHRGFGWGWWVFALPSGFSHDAFDEEADAAFSFCWLGDFGAWGEGA